MFPAYGFCNCINQATVLSSAKIYMRWRGSLAQLTCSSVVHKTLSCATAQGGEHGLSVPCSFESKSFTSPCHSQQGRSAPRQMILNAASSNPCTQRANKP
jgi:hypothetical protein